MAMKMNETDKNQMLAQYLPTGESYQAKVWAAIEAGADAIAGIGAISIVMQNMLSLGSGLGGALAGAGGALSNEFGYMGLTENRLVFVVVKKMDVSQVKFAFDLPFNRLKSVQMKKGFIPGKQVMTVVLDNKKIKFSIMSSSIGTDIENQKENVEILSKRFG